MAKWPRREGVNTRRVRGRAHGVRRAENTPRAAKPPPPTSIVPHTLGLQRHTEAGRRVGCLSKLKPKPPPLPAHDDMMITKFSLAETLMLGPSSTKHKRMHCKGIEQIAEYIVHRSLVSFVANVDFVHPSRIFGTTISAYFGRSLNCHYCD